MSELGDLIEGAGSLPLAVQRQYNQAQCLVTRQQADKALDQLAVKLSLLAQDQNPLLVTLLPEGAVLAGQLARRMVFPAQQTSLFAGPKQLATTGTVPSIDDRLVVLLGGRADDEMFASAQDWAQQGGAVKIVRVCVVDPSACSGESNASAENLVLISELTALEPSAAHDMQLFGLGLGMNGYGHNLAGLYAAPAI